MAENWTELIVGIIMIISPWVFGFSDISVAKWCDVLLGLAIVLVNIWALFGERPAMIPAVVEEPKKKILKNNVEPKTTI
jgi:hypothetical protein